jgi:tryptophan-rich sensory protein
MNPVLAGLVAFVVSFGLPIMVGASRKSYGQEWYNRLKKPSHAVSDLTINVVFIVIYISETVAFYHLLTIPITTDMVIFTTWFLITAILSGLWSRLFFQYKSCDKALTAFVIELFLIWGLISALYMNGISGWLFLLPRAIWGLYAVTVNYQLCRLNKDFWKSNK